MPIKFGESTAIVIESELNLISSTNPTYGTVGAVLTSGGPIVPPVWTSKVYGTSF